MISNPNIQVAFEYMANNTIAGMTHKQLWTSLNQDCSENLGNSNHRDITPWVDTGKNINFCKCDENKELCMYQEDKDIPIEKLQYLMRQQVKDTLNKYSDFYELYYGLEVTLRHEHITILWNKIFSMSDIDFTLELVRTKKERKNGKHLGTRD